jgi:hypothetical protein
MGFVDSYKVVIVTETEDGKRERQEHTNMSLADFEVLYGMIMDHIVYVNLKLMEGENGKHSSNSTDSEWKWKNNIEYS